MDRLAEFLSSREFWLPVAVAVLVLVLFIPFLLSLRRRLRSRLESFWEADKDDRLVHTRMANKTLDNLIPEIISITADKLLQDEVDDIEREGGKLLKRIAAEAEDKEVIKELNGREVTFREDVASTSLMSKYISKWKVYDAKAMRAKDCYENLAFQRKGERGRIRRRDLNEFLKRMGRPEIPEEPSSLSLSDLYKIVDYSRRKEVNAAEKLARTSSTGAKRFYRYYRWQKGKRRFTYMTTYLLVFLFALALLPGFIFDPIPIKSLSLLILPTILFTVDKLWLSRFTEPIFLDWRRWLLIQSVFELSQARLYAKCYAACVMIAAEGTKRTKNPTGD
jgi:hypothetical protein